MRNQQKQSNLRKAKEGTPINTNTTKGITIKEIRKGTLRSLKLENIETLQPRFTHLKKFDASA